MRSSLTDVGSGKVQIDSQGAGAELVIIHSLLTGPEAFDTVVSSLSRRFTVHRVHLPGFGRSTPLPKPDIAISDLAGVVVEAMAGLGTGSDATVLGNGLGSFVALTMAIEHGDGFGRLIACNTGPGFPDDRKGAFTTMSGLAESGGMTAVADVAIQRIFPPGFLDANPGVAEQRRAVLETIDPTAFAAACRALARLDLSDDLASLRNPTLVIAGEIDQTTPPTLGLSVADAVPGASFVEIPGCGHCPQLEKPAALVAEIERFVTTSVS